ncbi:MAG: hypothetical protein CBC13_05940 [Planctomycetia bacterium TMED53]|nr:MAG: hypothetical protein CBC13_05940 [Planctomycetia bacterium TMED53]
MAFQCKGWEYVQELSHRILMGKTEPICPLQNSIERRLIRGASVVFSLDLYFSIFRLGAAMAVYGRSLHISGVG